MINAKEAKAKADRKKETDRKAEIEANRKKRDSEDKWVKDNLDKYLDNAEEVIEAAAGKGYTTTSLEVPDNDAGHSLGWKLCEELKKEGYTATCRRDEGGPDWYDTYWVTISWGDRDPWK